MTFRLSIAPRQLARIANRQLIFFEINGKLADRFHETRCRLRHPVIKLVCLPQDNHLGMLVYAMVQEEATFLSYRNLKARVKELGRDPALEKLLTLMSIDEKAHHAFFRDCLKFYLEVDRAAVIEQLRRVMNDFSMPAIHDCCTRRPRRFLARTFARSCRGRWPIV